MSQQPFCTDCNNTKECLSCWFTRRQTEIAAQDAGLELVNMIRVHPRPACWRRGIVKPSLEYNKLVGMGFTEVEA